MKLKVALIAGLSIFLLAACSGKKANPYDEIFSDENKFVPINTKELKEVK
ncbi:MULTISPECIES: hypothetical protein [unclassified Helicobacter]|nr:MULTISPECIES: hypothetical protein [unclassified Helicobacter]